MTEIFIVLGDKLDGQGFEILAVLDTAEKAHETMAFFLQEGSIYKRGRIEVWGRWPE